MKIVLLLLLSISSISSGFSSLPQISTYAARHEEFPEPDNDNWLDADFTSYHKKIGPNWLNKPLEWLGFYRNGSWDPRSFHTLLQEVTQQRTTDFKSGRIVATLKCPNESKLYIWGDLHGAFHSFVRSLQWLEEQKVLDTNLKIQNPNAYFIFNGDAINRSPYILETLNVMLLLIKQNPNNVFYIRGNHEDKLHWINFGLKRELQTRAYSLTNEKIPLEKLVNTFFNTLPLALFVTTPEDLEHVIRISHRDRTDKELQSAENKLDTYLSQKESPIQYHTIDKSNHKNSKKIIVEAIVKTEPWRHEVKGKVGLGQLDQDRGAAAWVALSSPIQAHKEFLDFYFDAFALLTIHAPLSDSTIALYNRDTRNKEDQFKLVSAYNIASGMALNDDNTTDSSHEEKLVIGSSMSLVQGVPIMGQRIKRGMSIKINQENKKGGIHGQLIRAIIYNDDYIPPITKQNIDRLLTEDKTDIILLPVGSPTLNVYQNYLKNNKVLALFPITGSLEFRRPELKGVVHYRGTYEDEVEALIEYMINTIGARKFAFFYQDDAYGRGALQTAREELKKKGIKKWTEVAYLRGNTDFKTQVQKIRLAQPDAIGFFSTAQATRELMRLIGINFLANRELFGISFLGEESFRRYVTKHGLKVLFGAVVPNPHTSQLEIVKEYRQAMDEMKFPYDVFSLEAYIATSLLIEMMNSLEPPITKEKILQKLESLKNYEFKGLNLTFNPDTRSLAQNIWLESGQKDEWIKKPITHSKPMVHPVETENEKTNDSNLSWFQKLFN